MYAVFRTGGKQFRVEPGTKLRVPTLEAEEGTTVSFEHVLITSDGDAVSVGRPLVAGASVKAVWVHPLIPRFREELCLSRPDSSSQRA